MCSIQKLYLILEWMIVEYTWNLGQEKNCRQFRLQFPLSFFDWAVYPGGEEGLGGDRYFSLLQSSLYYRI